MTARALTMAAAGATPPSEKTYIEDVFATTLYTGNGSSQFVNTGVNLAKGYADDIRGTVLHLTGDGANGAQNNTFLDSSSNNFTITRNGNATQGSFSPYGSNWSNYFDGTGDYLSIADNVALDLPGDFTIEFWAAVGSGNVNRAGVVGHRNQAGGFDDGSDWVIRVETTVGKIGFGYASSGEYFDMGTYSIGEWAHYAITRSGSTVRGFKNGVLISTNTNSFTYSSGYPVYVGTNIPGYDFAGSISNLRIVKGTALYTSNFTPSTTPLTAVSGTSLLTCQSNRFIDNSTNNFTITRNGDVSVHKFSPFAPSAATGGSGYFDGDGDFLQPSANNAAFSMGTGDWTVEAWIYPTAAGGVKTIYAWRSNANMLFGSGNLYFYDGNFRDSGLSIPVGAWSHVAWVRQAGTLTPFVNGVQGTQYNNSGTMDAAYAPYIGNSQFGEVFAGNITGLRVTKSAVYTGAFTPPSAPPAAIANTSLLLNFANAGIADVFGNVDLETVGNVQISTSVKKYGTGSIYVPATTDAARTPVGLDFGTGNFTIEGWANPSISGSEKFLLVQGVNQATGFLVGLTTSEIRFRSNGASDIFASISPTGFYHFAIVRNGTGTNNVTVYVNGTSVAQGTYTNSIDPSSGVFNIGAAGLINSGFASYGYIDDLRITKGRALYVSNFTPPTKALPTVMGEYFSNDGLVWMKGRSNAYNNTLVDTVRGVSRSLVTDLTAAQDYTAGAYLTDFGATGFSVGFGTGSNGSGATYASWSFQKKAKFFDVVTWTGNGTQPRAITHNLGSAPGCIIVKRTDAVGDWAVYHRAVDATNPAGYRLELNTTNARAATSTTWNDQAPTATEFYIGSATYNASGGTYVAYLFAHDPTADGVIQCGSFTTDSSGTAPAITLGWEPQWIVYKDIQSSTDNWNILDNMRGLAMTSNAYLQPNRSAAESSASTYLLKPSATGFYADTGTFSANHTYVYMVIRRGPMRTPTNGTKVFSPVVYSGTGSSDLRVTSPFPVDFSIITNRTLARTYNNVFADRLRGPLAMVSSPRTAAELTTADWVQSFAYQDGISLYNDNAVNMGGTDNHIAYFFRRAPSFFDQVCWTSTGSTFSVSHGLAAVPELVLLKWRNGAQEFRVFFDETPSGSTMARLNSDAAASYYAYGANWGAQSTTTTITPLGATAGRNYVAYLFASCPGVSKVGSYTGDGTSNDSKTINCGFSAGTRFLLIKRTDAAGDWYVWDTARGFRVGFYNAILRLNTTAAEQTITPVGPTTTGFYVSNDSYGLNVSGATYTYLAIA